MSPVIRDEPLAVELHNTIYASSGEIVDALADGDGLAAWLRAERRRLPVAAKAVDTSRLGDFVALREAVRDALAVAAAGPRVPRHGRAAPDAASERRPPSPELSPAREAGAP